MRICCGTPYVTVGPLVRVKRGKPAKPRISRMVYHKKGDQRFWHWEDQTGRLTYAEEAR